MPSPDQQPRPGLLLRAPSSEQERNSLHLSPGFVFFVSLPARLRRQTPSLCPQDPASRPLSTGSEGQRAGAHRAVHPGNSCFFSFLKNKQKKYIYIYIFIFSCRVAPEQVCMATVCGLPQPQLRTKACAPLAGGGGRTQGDSRRVGGRLSEAPAWAGSEHRTLGRGPTPGGAVPVQRPCCVPPSPGCGASKKGAPGTAPGQKLAPHPEVPGWMGGARAGAAIVSPSDASCSLEKEASALWRAAPRCAVCRGESQVGTAHTILSLATYCAVFPSACPTLSSDPHLVLCFLPLIVSSRLQIILIIWGPNHVH